MTEPSPPTSFRDHSLTTPRKPDRSARSWVTRALLLAWASLAASACTANIEGPPSAGSFDSKGEPCQRGLTSCNGVCVNLQSESTNCGSCGTTCIAPAVCANGSCSTACVAGFQKCGADCVNVATDSAHCGSCEKTCDAGVPCFGGVCGCPEGASLQGGQCRCAQTTDVVCDSACRDPKTDAQHCGDCKTQCLGGQLCAEGKCSCPLGETLCGGKCVSTDSNAAHCGACDVPCPMGQSCQVGKCSGVFGDSCTGTLAVGINIDSISVYQAGKIPVMVADSPVAKADRPADVIQGKPGRVRVFAKRGSGWVNRTVSARLLLRNGDLKSNYFSKRSVTQDSVEESFATTFNFDVKAEDFAATTRYAVEIVECEGPPAGAPGKSRFPLTGDQELVTRKTGTIKLRFVPLNANGRLAQSDDARLEAYRAYLALIYPTSGVEVTVGRPLDLSQRLAPNGGGWSEALDQLSALHEADDAANDTYYYGLLQPGASFRDFCDGGCVAGVGFQAGTESYARHSRVALGLSYASPDSAETMAHEVGHNHGLPHSPCGGADDPDKAFPYPGGKLGWWGFEAPEKLHNPAISTDMMGYCDSPWVSDYVYRSLTDRVAFLNGSLREVPPPGGMQHYLFLLTDTSGPRWGLERRNPRYPSGKPELADILDANGKRIESVTVYRTPFDHRGGALLLVPDPKPGWHAIHVRGVAPLRFGAKSSSLP